MPEIPCPLPSELRGKFGVRVIYSFGKTIGAKILNYNNVLRNTGNLSYADILSMDCSCVGSPFKHDQFEHIITGDLSIIRDPLLREVCSFGTKFRENPCLDINKIKDQIKKDLDNLAIKMSNKFRISRGAFKAWKRCLFDNFNKKLLACINKTNYRRPVLMRQDCKRELLRLQDEFVISVVDKAAGNFAFTCKKFYFLRLAED